MAHAMSDEMARRLRAAGEVTFDDGWPRPGTH